MTKKTKGKSGNPRSTEAEKETPGSESAPDEYLYTTAGIRERSGTVPAWLIAVVVGLLAWGGYYLVVYWTPN